MLIKTLITTTLLIAALSSNGTTSVATATGSARQELIPVPLTDPSDPPCPGEPTQDLREEFHQTYPLSATGRVGLENINGGVTIKVWDRPAVQVDAVKKAYRQSRLAEARIEVTSTEESIRIKTEYPDENQNFRSGEGRYDNPAIVEYTLTIPRKATLDSIELINGHLDIDGVEGNVKASSINGRVNARGLMGDARLSTVNGPLQATFTQLNEARPINLSSVNGNLTLIIPSNANAAVRAGTVHGGISNSFGLKVKDGEYVGHSLDGQIGNGGTKIKLGNVNGGITISNAQDGLPLSPGASAPNEGNSPDADIEVNPDVQVDVGEIVRAGRESARVAREAQRDAQRQVAIAMRDAQKELERAQREVARENARTQRIETVNRVRIENSSKHITSQESRTFSVSGSPRVTINTFDGRVTIHGWDKPEVSFTATKSAHDDESLKQITVDAQQQGQVITINARSEEGNEDGSVNLDVNVPRQTSLHVSSGDGALNLDGVTGQITLRSGDGPIEVANGGGQLQLNTGDGLIRVIKFDGQVDARTGDGAIALDGNFNAVSARTGEGEISLTVPAGSSFTIETNAPDEISNEGFVVAEDVTLSPRVKRWKIGNGGTIFVLKTGEGRILLRPKK